MSLHQVRGAELVRDVVQDEDADRLCFVRGPEGVIVGLAQPLDGAAER